LANAESQNRSNAVPSVIPIMRPLLPSAQRVAPYLRRIDESRIYSNFGPLALSLERRIEEHYCLPDETATTVANGTLGLSLALSAQSPRPGTLCVLPAWTFVASAHASMLAGLTPFFVDVDPRTWALDPRSVKDAIARAPATVGAVMPVVPFGQPIDVAAWDDFRTNTGLPVVIDAAAGFDSLVPSDTPSVVSLHATKVLGAGEGSFVIAKDRSLIQTIRSKSNFGFQGTREARVSGANAKLSEYHAAVAHAALDEWQHARAQWIEAADAYRIELPQSSMRFQEGFGHSWVTSTCVVDVGEAALHVERVLGDASVETRRWWGNGAHAHTATVGFPRAPLPVTERLAKTTIAIPFFRDMERKQVQKISELFRAALHHGTPAVSIKGSV
jgi:dTDP-4-amino-4,6-dideoxygalactose transaminase